MPWSFLELAERGVQAIHNSVGDAGHTHTKQKQINNTTPFKKVSVQLANTTIAQWITAMGADAARRGGAATCCERCDSAPSIACLPQSTEHLGLGSFLLCSFVANLGLGFFFLKSGA